MSASWAYSKLDDAARLACLHEARSRFPFARVEPLPPALQGGCSLSFALTQGSQSSSYQTILQFRPKRFAIDTSIAAEAKAVYGEYAPVTELVSKLLVFGHGFVYLFRISKIEGLRYSCILPRSLSLRRGDMFRQRRYIASFADFLARGWHHSLGLRQRVESLGKVGRRLREKVELLAVKLPSPALRRRAALVHNKLHYLDQLPMVLCHGDTIPSNILVNESTHSIQGLIDWAEAEHLPFGIPIYGLEYMLGCTEDTITKSCFRYYSSAGELRQHFWNALEQRIPELGKHPRLLDAVLIARDVGVLLWYGYAWDNGAVDRVVNTRDDAAEVMLLETFLFHSSVRSILAAQEVARI